MTKKLEVTNNSRALLNIAGVDARPGATVAVDAKEFEIWKNGHAASIWLDQGLVVAGKAPAAKAEAQTDDDGSDGDDEKPAKVDRAAYLTKAKDLGLDLPGNVSNTKLVEAVNEAEAKKAGEGA